MEQVNIIDEIILVKLDDILLEFHLNLFNNKIKRSISIQINNDGESIFVNSNIFWITKDKTNKIGICKIINEHNDEDLSIFINKKIKTIQYGIGFDLKYEKNVLYYLKIDIEENIIFFLNSGDNLYYTINDYSKLLEDDIFNITWHTIDLSNQIIFL